MVTSIIIPCWNKLELTQGCVESLQAFTHEPHEVVFIDNGSTDGTETYLAGLCVERPNYTLLRNEKNLGFVVAVNQGVQFAKGERICVLNNDVVVTPEWLTGLHECMDHQENIGCVGPMTNYISGIQQVNEGRYDTMLGMIEFSRTFRKAFKGRWFSHWRLPFFCTLIKRDVWDAVGMLDEQFSPGNFEDDDFLTRSVKAGFRHFVAGDVFIHHFGSMSCRDLDFKGILDANRKKYMDKWLRKTVSCCMIVKNEEQNMQRCLERISQFVDEVIVVDTGSTDRTKEIAATFPKVRLFDFPWVNDFAAARNFSLDQATNDWVFVLDADELVNGVMPPDPHPMCAYRVETRNYTNNTLWSGNINNTGEYGEDEKGCFWFSSTKVRLWPNDKRVRFQYPVHEVVEESIYHMGLFVDQSPFPVHHYGKMDESVDNGKNAEYVELLKGIIADDPRDIRSMEQLAAGYQMLKKWEEAIEVWDRIIALDPLHGMAWHNKGHAIVHHSRNWQEALACFEKAVQIRPQDKDSRYNRAYANFMLGNLQTSVEQSEELVKDNPDFVLGIAIRNAAKKKLEGLNNG